MKLIEKIQPVLICVLTVAVSLLLFKNYIQKDKIVYINTPKILAQYEGMRNAEMKFKEQAENYKSNLDTLYNELQASLKDFEKNRVKMSAKELKISEELLNTKKEQFIAYQQATEKKASEEENKIKENALKRVNELIPEYGKSKNYEYIFGATALGNIVYAKDMYDVTDEVIAMLNKKYREENGKR